MYPITLRVMTDQRPMPGAQIFYRTTALGATDVNGMFQVETPGVEGTTLELTVRCPEGFISPERPVPVTLRSTIALGEAGRPAGIETTTQCPPSHRIAAVVVRTPSRANLPIFYDGHEITRTDLQGVAHMIFRVRPAEVLTLRIDTSQQPLLRPQNPMLSITTRDGDDVYVSSQNFDEVAPPPAPSVRRSSGPSGPTRIPARRNWAPF